MNAKGPAGTGPDATTTNGTPKSTASGESLRWMWLKAIRDDRNLSATEKLVAYTLSMHMDGDGSNCFPGDPLIVAESSLGITAVKDARRRLRKRGYLKVAEQGGSPPGGQRRASVYLPVIPTGSPRDRVTSRPGRDVTTTGSSGGGDRVATRPPDRRETDMETERGTVEFDMYETFGGDVAHNLEQLAAEKPMWKTLTEDPREVRQLLVLFQEHGRGALAIALQQARDDPSKVRRPGAWLRTIVPKIAGARRAS